MTNEQQHALQDQRHREALAVEMAGLRADAERYRFYFGDDDAHKKARVEIELKWLAEDGVRTKAGWDAAIDAAMQEGK
jgi:hypothetical protein